ncbi:uncharacterized protein DSM5745_10504 [Aspergillus mulundensis]|uniref:Uncharacterized protein n=1 Tax=Aspergillus mulundensis TaxID=1810919 RepID=A0A3D8QJ36_9EURO|nr:hypothetical protein DSM5745_10504 [Aspergillus mulundensis]RDW61832.1 hypothetical protein DSM5745_10504 [Aspergillus mulundensis]
MSVTTASLSGNWYSFTNVGPLTTTFTPAPTCSSSNQMLLGYVTTSANVEFVAGAELLVQCTSPHAWGAECTPSGTPLPTTAPPDDFDLSYEEYMESQDSQTLYGAPSTYFSPGLYCPKGWETIGVAARDARSVLTSSGFLVPSTITAAVTTSTSTSTSTETDENYDGHVWEEYMNPVMALKEALQPKQTLAVCCPSGMTIDSTGFCYSTIPDYKPSSGCVVATYYRYMYETTTWTDSRGIVSESHIGTPTDVLSSKLTLSTIFDSTETLYSGVMGAHAITLLHHDSDLRDAVSASASASAASASEEPTDNAAGRTRMARAASWEGVGAVAGIWAGAMLLGALMVLPW